MKGPPPAGSPRRLPRAPLRTGRRLRIALARGTTGSVAMALAAGLAAFLAVWFVGSNLVGRAHRPAAPVAPRPVAAPDQPKDAGTAFVFEPPYDSLDGLTLIQGRYRIRLASVEGPSRDAICTGGDGGLWACGLQARAALHNLAADKPLVCRPLAPGRTDLMLADCEIEGADLAQALVAGGWARPQAGREAAFQEGLAVARRDRRGLWNGGWRVRGGS